MKKTAALSMLCFFFLQLSAQTNPSDTETDYLRKSKKQKTAAWILAGSGAGLVLIGATTKPNPNAGVGPGGPGEGTGAVTITVGSLAMLGSIPLFIASSRNKKLATSVGLRKEYGPRMQKTGLCLTGVPSVYVTVKL